MRHFFTYVVLTSLLFTFWWGFVYWVVGQADTNADSAHPTAESVVQKQPVVLQGPAEAPSHRPQPGQHAPAEQQNDQGERITELRGALGAARNRVRWLETELALCGSGLTQGSLGRWLSLLRPEERPSEQVLRRLGGYLKPYEGVVLAPYEGLWLAERTVEDDWLSYGPTIDEAIISYLGPQRLAQEVEAEQLELLSLLWAEEGYFSE